LGPRGNQLRTFFVIFGPFAASADWKKAKATERIRMAENATRYKDAMLSIAAVDKMRDIGENLEEN